MVAYESIAPSRRPLNAHTHTHTSTQTHTAYSENNQQLPGSALLLLLSHNCSRASPLSAPVRPSQAANHQQPLWLASPPGSNRPTMEPIVFAQHAAHSTDIALHFHFYMISSFMGLAGGAARLSWPFESLCWLETAIANS